MADPTRLWQRWFPRARISTRIVAAVVATMTAVLLCADVFVFWRISFALGRQLDQDLRGYAAGVAADLEAGRPLPADNPGEAAQTYAADGQLVAASDVGVRRLLTTAQVSAAGADPRVVDLGGLLPPPSVTPYRVSYRRIDTAAGPVVLATAISRNKHDEALRELLLQLALAGLATVVASGAVGWAATRAALGPVERYRRAAEAGGGAGLRLPVDGDRDDELTRLGATFNRLLAEIEEGAVRERRFLADASHELRSPLAVLAAEVEWARRRPRSAAELDTVLASVGDQTRRLAALADGVLDLEEVTSSVVRRRPTSLTALVASAASGPRAAAQRVGRSLVTDVPDLQVSLEDRWVERALTNLLDNAVKHGAGEVRLSAAVVGPDLVVQVLDQGGGVPAGLGERAFERFARADEARTRPGSGLGLAIVGAVAARHGGSASLVPGGVALTLPREESQIGREGSQIGREGSQIGREGSQIGAEESRIGPQDPHQ